jgi:serine/threonine-protein kinase
MGKLEIDPASWTVLNRLLDDVLDRPPGERSQWVDSLTEEFAPLKPQLRELLARAASVETGEFLRTVPKFGGAAAERASSASPGELVGGYRLVREIGVGGMGSVWLAERADGLIQRPVALKLPHIVAARSAGIAERMAREREILATLDHRNIAKLLDAGVTADGQPFLALEYIEGIPIDHVCAGAGGGAPPDIAARLKLFRQVADAVAYAHGKLVVHRDLKPANILVTAGGGVKLLDFGIAKLLDEGRAFETRLTQVSGRALTPDYASPEQILGEPLTVASDVYSLGVVLYEMLADARPYQLKRDSRGALEDAILQSVPPRPSQVAPAARRRQLQGDLDTIALKALKKNPQERYATVNALSEDIARHLDNRPVLARPDSGWYRIRKFVRRNRLAVGVASATFAAVLLAGGIAVWQMFEAHAQRDQAQRMRERAQASSEFLGTMLDELGHEGKPMTLADSLDRSTAILERNYSKNEALNASMLYEAALRYSQLEKSERELQLLERVIASARKHSDHDLFASAQCSAAHTLSLTDRTAAAARLAEVDALASRVKFGPAVGWTCARPRATLLEADGNPAAAIALLEQTLARDLASAPAERMPVQDRVALLGDVGHMQFKADRIAATLATNAEAIALLEEAGRDQSMNMVVLLFNHAAILTRVGQISTAEKQQERALALAAQVEPDGKTPVGMAMHLATSKLRLNDFAAAASLAAADSQRARDAGNERMAALADLLQARALGKLGRGAEADVILARAEASLRGNAKGNERLLNEVEMTRAEQSLRAGDAAAARQRVDEVLAKIGYPENSSPPGLASVLFVGVKVALAQGDPQTAERWSADALAREEKVALDWRNSAGYGQAALNRADALVALGRNAEALQIAERAEIALSAGFTPDHADTIRARALRDRLRT